MPLANSRDRAARVAYLRSVAGLPWSAIRDECGFTSIGAAQSAYKSHRRRNPIPNGEFVFAELLDRHNYRNQQGVLAIRQAQALGDYSVISSLIRALSSNDADLARWFGIDSQTVNVNVSTSVREIISETRARLLAVVDAEVVEPREIAQ